MYATELDSLGTGRRKFDPLIEHDNGKEAAVTAAAATNCSLRISTTNGLNKHYDETRLVSAACS